MAERAQRRLPHSLGRVLVAIKPWQRGLPLEAQHAAQLAQAVNGQLMLMSAVFDSRVAGRAAHDNPKALAARGRMLEAERVELERLAQSLRDWGATVSTRVVWEAPAYQGIVNVASEWQADLLVVGVHEHGVRLGTRLTDTDWQLMRLAPCPLLLVKDPAFDGYPTILAAVDPTHPQAASGVDQAVLDVARKLAIALRSELRAVHAMPPAVVAPGVYYDSAHLQNLERCALHELLAPYGVGEERLDVAPGKAAEVILQATAARRAGLVVVGALKRGALAQAVLGSTAEVVAMEAACDVLLVPPPRAAERPASASGKPAAAVKGKARTTKPAAAVKGKARTTKPRRRSAS